MTQSGSETPGIGGVPGVAAGTTRAPAAWRQLIKGLTRTAPESLRRSADSRRRILRVKR